MVSYKTTGVVYFITLALGILIKTLLKGLCGKTFYGRNKLHTEVS
jgi:hypothetical protein